MAQWAGAPRLDSAPAGAGSRRDRASAVAAANRAGASLVRMGFLGRAHFRAARAAAGRERPRAPSGARPT
eukprot:2236746-Pyramimonas_sp.AAC.1